MFKNKEGHDSSESSDAPELNDPENIKLLQRIFGSDQEDVQASKQESAQTAEQFLEKIAFDYGDDSLEFMKNFSRYYENTILNSVLRRKIQENNQVILIPSVHSDYEAKMIEYQLDLESQLQMFLGDHNLKQILMPIYLRIGSEKELVEHFVSLYILKKENGSFVATYIDPAALTEVPDNIMQFLIRVLGLNEIHSTFNVIQSRNDEDYLTNVHYGAFTSFILSELASGNIRTQENKLQIYMDDEEKTWNDIPDLTEEESDRLGKSIRAHDLRLLSETKISENPYQVLIGIVVARNNQNLNDYLQQSDDHYTLKRSDSGMSQYSDLVDEILDEPQFSDASIKQKECSIVDVICPTPERIQVLKEIKAIESENRRLGQFAAEHASEGHKITPEKKNKQQAANNKKKAILQAKKKTLPENTEVNYDEIGINKKKMHLFRGKNLNSKVIDAKTKQQRVRTKKEIEGYVTRKYKGKTLYSDGAESIEDNLEALKKAELETREYFQHIKGHKTEDGATILFNAGTSYDKAVDTLMKKTGLPGNTVVATSKLPWVGSEYMVGQMGGNAGSGRSVNFGYQKDGKPVNRIMGNGFIISLPLEDYRALRESDDLIDVNIDIARGIDPNRTIEEITFVVKVAGKYVLGSLPMILPRLDRDWGEMAREKHAQYARVFGLDKNMYKKFKDLLQSEEQYPLGMLTEHLIRHHGSLMRKMAIKIDREGGYQDDFVITRNPQYYGEVEDINKEGQKLRLREARTGSAGKKTAYLKLEEKKEPETPQKSQIPRKTDLADTQQRTPAPMAPYFKMKSSGNLVLSDNPEDGVDEITEKFASQSSISEKNVTVTKPASLPESHSSPTGDDKEPKIPRKLSFKK